MDSTLPAVNTHFGNRTTLLCLLTVLLQFHYNTGQSSTKNVEKEKFETRCARVIPIIDGKKIMKILSGRYTSHSFIPMFGPALQDLVRSPHQFLPQNAQNTRKQTKCYGYNVNPTKPNVPKFHLQGGTSTTMLMRGAQVITITKGRT